MAEKVCSRMNLSCFGNDYEHLFYSARVFVASEFKGHLIIRARRGSTGRG